MLVKDPLLYNKERMLMDGGVLDNLPLSVVDVTSDNGEILAYNRKAIGFKIMPCEKWVPEYTEINSFFKYTMAFIDSLHNKIHVDQSNQPYFWDRVVPINTCGVNMLTLDITPNTIMKIVNIGMKCAQKFLQKRREMIQINGPLPENLFIPSHRLRHHGIEHLSDDLVENTHIYKTNSRRYFNRNIPSYTS